MGIDTKKFQSAVDKLKTSEGKGIRNYIGLELIIELRRYTKNEIPAELMRIATPREYSMSRLWRARDIPDILIRNVSDCYYRWIEFPILKHKLALSISKPF